MLIYDARSEPSSAAVASAANVDLHTLGERHERQSRTLARCWDFSAEGTVKTTKMPSCEVECAALLHEASVYVTRRLSLFTGTSRKINPKVGVCLAKSKASWSVFKSWMVVASPWFDKDTAGQSSGRA